MDIKQENQDKKKIISSQKAVALKYDPHDVAPKVVAKGAGYVADKIMEQGRQNKVPVHKDAKLVEELTQINVGDNIPPELYEVVAQVLIFISDLDRLEEYKRNVK